MNSIDIAGVDLNLFKVFEALFQEGSASRAAERLDVTQSAVSAALRRLRILLADPLFVRTGHGLSPTLRASDLFPLITDALDKCRQSLDLVAADTSNFAGRSVVIALSDDFEMSIGQPLVKAVDQQAPGLRLVFRQTHSRVVADMLLTRECDLAISSGGFSMRSLSREVFGKGGYACIVDTDSLQTGQSSISMEEFVTRKHILISAGGFVGLVDETLSAMKLKRQVLMSTTHFSALSFLMKGTSAVATLPSHAAHAIAASGQFTKLPCPIEMPRYPVELGWRADSLRNPAVLKVKSITADILGKYPWQ